VTPDERDRPFVERYGPWAVVTGASQGIGRAFAEALAAKGVQLVLVARREPLLHELAQRLQGLYGVECVVVAADLRDPASSQWLLAATHDRDVGLLVAAAGFGLSGPLLDSSPTEQAAMLDVNCRAVLTQSFIYGERLVRRGRGGVVLMSSLMAFQGTPLSAHYAATKAYVQSLAEGLCAEWSPLGVDVVACAPGPIDSGFAERANMHMAQTQTPDVVARATLARLHGGGTVRPGSLAKVLGWSLATAPRALRVAIMGRIVAGMTAHQRTRFGRGA
jgi:uncharacterized protein